MCDKYQAFNEPVVVDVLTPERLLALWLKSTADKKSTGTLVKGPTVNAGSLVQSRRHCALQLAGTIAEAVSRTVDVRATNALPGCNNGLAVENSTESGAEAGTASALGCTDTPTETLAGQAAELLTVGLVHGMLVGLFALAIAGSTRRTR